MLQLLVAGDPRPVAQAKHCDWVVARQALEQLKQQAGVDEVVLSDSNGALLECLASNFYVIADPAQLPPSVDQHQAAAQAGQNQASAVAAQGSAVVDAGSDSAHHNERQHQEQQPHAGQQQQGQQGDGCVGVGGGQGWVLLTTGPGADALWGITQQRVMQACEQLRLPVKLQPARLDSAPAWREVFMTNW